VSALDGITKVVLTIPIVPEHQQIAASWINALRTVVEKKGSVRHIIYLSQAGADDPAFMFAHWHAWNEVLLGSLSDKNDLQPGATPNVNITFVRSGVLFQVMAELSLVCFGRR